MTATGRAHWSGIRPQWALRCRYQLVQASDLGFGVMPSRNSATGSPRHAGFGTGPPSSREPGPWPSLMRAEDFARAHRLTARH